MLKIISVILGIVALLFLSAVPSFAATISITNYPSSTTLLQEFSISFSGSGLDASLTYYAKVRIGQAGSDSNPYDQGETKNGDSWLGDSSTWENFPVFTTDSSGVVSDSLTARAKSTAPLGDNSIFIRLRKSGTTTNTDSTAATVTLTAATPTPSPTPTPTQEPSPTTTPTPTSSPTPTPTPSPSPTATPRLATTASSTSTPKPATPSPTPVGTSKITTASTTSTPESLVLGITDVSSTSANTEEGATAGSAVKEGKALLGLSGKQYLAGGLAVLGALFLGISIFLFFKERTSAKIDKVDEID